MHKDIAPWLPGYTFKEYGFSETGSVFVFRENKENVFIWKH
jgi:hypothetical protein